MHHVKVEAWNKRQSFLHRRDPRAKSIVLLGFLIALGTADRNFAAAAACYLAVLLIAIAVSGLPIFGILSRSALVLPFSLTFALISYLGGDAHRALLLAGKSYLSALGVLVLIATTPLPHLLRGLEYLRVPRLVLMVMQFLYRYLFVISEEAQHMRSAGASRGGTISKFGGSRDGFRAAAGVLGVLFARSHTRAQSIHFAMLSRGFQGTIPTFIYLQFLTKDVVFLTLGLVIFGGIRWASGAIV